MVAEKLLIELEPIGMAGRALRARNLLTGEELATVAWGATLAAPMTVEGGRSMAVVLEPAE